MSNIVKGLKTTIKQEVFDPRYKEINETIAKSKKMIKHNDEDYKKIQEYMKGKYISQNKMRNVWRNKRIKYIKAQKDGWSALTTELQ